MFSLFQLLYFKFPRGEEDDRLIWSLTGSGYFYLCSYYNYIFGCLTASFPWKRIWSVKGPKRVLFFFMGSSSICLQLITLLRGDFPWLIGAACVDSRCCGEIVEHLLLHCEFSHALWSEIFLMFGDSVGDARKGSIFSA